MADQSGTVRERLQRRRRELLGTRLAEERGASEVREGRTDPEYEEWAQSDLIESTAESLSDQQRLEVEMIDAALARLEAGTYGECAECGSRISPERLRALPYALRCSDCAEQHESATPHSHPTL